MNLGTLLLESLRLQPRVPVEQLRTEWPRADLTGLSDLLTLEQGAVWLARRLKAAGVTPPEPFGGWLTAAARRIAAQGFIIDSEVERLAGRLTALGADFVLLKGSARRVAVSRYPFADARPTHDIDLLVPAGAASGIWEALRATGYEPVPPPPGVIPDTVHHLAPLWGAARVAVEIHTSLARGLPADVAWRRATAGGTAIDWRGMRVRVPAATELLWHGLTHALQDPLGAFRLRFLLDGTAIIGSEEAVDWEEIGRRLASPEVPDRPMAVAWVSAAADLAGRVAPSSAVPGGMRFNLERAYAWRVWVTRRWAASPRLVERLLEEGTRAELGWPVASGIPGTSTYRRARRRLASLGARLWYRWTMLRGSAPG